MDRPASRERWHRPSLFAFTGAIVVLICAGVASYISVTKTTSTSNHLEDTSAFVAALEQGLSDVTVAQLSQRTYVGTKDPRLLESYTTSMDASRADIAEMQRLARGKPAREAAVASVAQRFDNLAALLATGVPPTAGGPATPVTPATGEAIRTAAEDVRGALRSLQSDENALVQQQARDADAAAYLTVVVTASVSAVAVLVLIAAYVFLNRQIVRRQRAEAALAQSLAEATDLYENAPCGYFSVDSSGQITSINATALRWLGFDHREILGTALRDHLREHSRPILEANAATLAETGDIHEIELDFERKDGTSLPVLLNATSSPGPSGEVQVRATIFDISERRRADAHIERLNANLAQHSQNVEAANKELEAFCYSVSHDLRAPLRTIDGFSKALLEDYESTLDESGQHLLTRIRVATQRMGQLIDDLLNLSRVTRGEFNREPLDLTSMARSIVNELASAEPDRAVDLAITDGVAGDGDPRLLRVVLENLLNNAWKYTGKKSKASIAFGSRVEGHETVYYVRDDGAGFDMQYANKLFGVFQRLHNVEDFPGTGVGLATVQRIVHRHGGRVWAESEVDRGACFYFTLAPKHLLAAAA